MPVNPCSENNQPGFKWGDSGKCYIYERGNAKSMGEAKKKATVQGIATGEYKRRGGGYKTMSKEISKVAEDLMEEEAALADALVTIASNYGKFNEDETGIWAGYYSPEENEVKSIGVKCANCVLYEGDGVCKIIAQQVEDEGKCRFAVIPDGLVSPEMEDEEEEDDEEENLMSSLISIIRDLLLNKEK
jgi:hypothetical protein